MFLGQMGYGNLGYYLFPMIIALVSGLIFLWACVFTAPTKKSLLTFFFLVGIYGYYFWFTGSDQLGEKDGLVLPLQYGIAFQIIIGLLSLGLRKILKKTPILEPPLWNQSARFKSLITPGVMVLIWALTTSEVIGLFEGYSFFAFGSGLEGIIQIILDLIIIGFIIGWVLVERKRKTQKQ
jgi:hypothetical protein